MDIFGKYLLARNAEMQHGQNALQMTQAADAIQKDRKLRNVLSQAYTPSIPANEVMGPMQPGQEPVATRGRMDLPKALDAMYREGFGPEAIKYETAMKSKGGLPSTVQEWQFYNSLPKEDQTRFLNMKRQGYSIKDIAGVPTRIPMNPGSEVQPLSTLPAEAEAAGTIKGAEVASAKEEERKAKLTAEEPKARMTADISRQKAGLVNKTIDKAVSQVSLLTAGPGSMTSGIPGSPAKNLAETLNTIRANVGFDRLQEMRESSKTGGALGQVSEMENKLLQSVIASMDQAQSPAQLKENLEIVRNAIQTSWKRVAAAYEQDYGKPMPTEGTPLDVSRGTDAPQAAIDYLKSNNYPAMRKQFKAKYGYLPD